MLLRFSMVSFVLLVAAADARAFCRLTTDMPIPGNNCATSGVGLEWRKPCISFSMLERRRNEPSFGRVRNVADDSFGTWLDVTCGGSPVGLDVRQTIQLGECAEPEYSPRAPNANTIIFIEDWRDRELPGDAFGLTLVWHNPDDGEIYDADMQINETLGQLTICGGVCPHNHVDIQNVITHEAGHFLGLGHTSETTATMSARASVGEVSKRDLDQDDRDGLCAIYGENPPAMCEQSEYVPDNGFSPQCWAGITDDEGNGGCSVRAAVPGRAARAPLALMAGVWIAAALRARRRRAAARS